MIQYTSFIYPFLPFQHILARYSLSKCMVLVKLIISSYVTSYIYLWCLSLMFGCLGMGGWTIPDGRSLPPPHVIPCFVLCFIDSRCVVPGLPGCSTLHVVGMLYVAVCSWTIACYMCLFNIRFIDDHSFGKKNFTCGIQYFKINYLGKGWFYTSHDNFCPLPALCFMDTWLMAPAWEGCAAFHVVCRCVLLWLLKMLPENGPLLAGFYSFGIMFV